LVVYEQRERPRFLRRADTAAAWALDVGIAILTLIPTVAVLGHGDRPGAHGTVAKVIVGAVLSVAPLIVRRRWPVQVLAFILLVALAVPGPAVFWPPALVALYTIASRRPWRVAAVSTLATVVVFVLHRVIWDYSLPLFSVISQIALPCLALVLGLYQATRLAYLEQLHQRADRLERERELLTEQAATEERLRIARELHDVVAHNVSLMVVQAQALGAHVGDQDQVREGTQAIADLGRGAMGEMHRTLELMRPGDGDGERAPQPTLAGLGALIEHARAAGVAVELSVDGSPRVLDAGIELSAYRIVQEALTNVVKHAGPAHAAVRLRYGEEQLALEIVDDGGGRAQREAQQQGPRSGHGLVGMRERVALFGGTLHAGPYDGRGYRVQALLPYGTGR
jgi:signal transduction histidine kinase